MEPSVTLYTPENGSLPYKVYEYTPLSPNSEEIRLVYILPGPWSAPVMCELHVLSTDTLSSSTLAPSFQTLSYVWGNPHITRPIQVDGCVFEVTTNLYAALRRLRQKNEVKRMWIDALCINQRDNDERTRQVMMMGRTYTRCSEVIIWLGDSVDGSEELSFSPIVKDLQGVEVMEDERTIEDGTLLFQQNLENGVYPQLLSPSTPDLAHASVGNAFAVLYALAQNLHFSSYDLFVQTQGPRRNIAKKYAQSLQALHNIMKRPYWNRIWVVQEAILPSSAVLVCGSISVPWQLFVNAGYGYNSHSTACCHMQWSNLVWRTVFVDFSFIVRIVDLARSRRRAGNQVTLYWLLKQYFDREATDPRDKAYGLLGLVNDWGDEEPLVPDYDISARDLYEDLTMRIIASTRSLEILMGQSLHHTEIDEGGNSNKENMPSWVADWGRLPDAREWDWEQGPWTMYQYYSASLRHQVVAESLPGSILRVRGVQVDEIVAVGTLMTVENQTIEFVSLRKVISLFPLDIFPNHLGPETRYPIGSQTGEGEVGLSLEEAYYRTLRGDITYRPDSEDYNKYTRTQPEDRHGYELWRDGFKHSDVGQDGDPAAFRLFWKSTVEAVRNRRFFVTRRGMLGLGPKGTKVGDEVIVLDGSRVPFVFRADTRPPMKEEEKGQEEEKEKEEDGYSLADANETSHAHASDQDPSITREASNLRSKRKKLLHRFQAKLRLLNRQRLAPIRQFQGLALNQAKEAESMQIGDVRKNEREGAKQTKKKMSEGNPALMKPMFKLVGDAYVHGIMDGEVYGSHEDGHDGPNTKKAVDIFLS